MTGEELRQRLVAKWGYSYDIQLRKGQGKMLVQIMWRYLEQASFPLSELEYVQHLNWVISHLESWGTVDQVCEGIEQTRDRPRVGHAVTIALELGNRASEWLIEGR